MPINQKKCHSVRWGTRLCIGRGAKFIYYDSVSTSMIIGIARAFAPSADAECRSRINPAFSLDLHTSVGKTPFSPCGRSKRRRPHQNRYPSPIFFRSRLGFNYLCSACRWWNARRRGPMVQLYPCVTRWCQFGLRVRSLGHSAHNL